MLFKNYRKTSIRAADEFGNVIIFAPYEQRELPAHLDEMACAAGLVPVDEFELQVEAEQRKEKEDAEANAQRILEESQAETARLAALEDAAEKARRSEAAKKAAATRAANAAK